jgi:hypothetical protein
MIFIILIAIVAPISVVIFIYLDMRYPSKVSSSGWRGVQSRSDHHGGDQKRREREKT